MRQNWLIGLLVISLVLALSNPLILDQTAEAGFHHAEKVAHRGGGFGRGGGGCRNGSSTATPDTTTTTTTTAATTT